MKDLVKKLELILFANRGRVLALFAVFTVVMAYFALQLRMEAGFEKQLPIGHEYVKTFHKYKEQLFGANRLTVVVKARHGNIWNRAALTKLYNVTQAVIYLPNIDRLGVQSLWTPNSFVNEITEDGFRAQPIIPGDVTIDSLSGPNIESIRLAAGQGGFIGTLVSRDQSGAMITAEILESDIEGRAIDYVAYNHILEKQLREKFEDGEFIIEIIGFAKQTGDIADGASSVLVFCLFALLLTGLSVYWYCHSVRFTLLPIVCSLTSLVWQFGTLRLMGFGLDPLGVLVPFLVFSVGVSHGVQQINFIVRLLSKGCSTDEAARQSFTGLLVPGFLALVTAFISFITLLLIPIPMIREVAVTASLGVGYKIFTNLVMLPLAASYCHFSKEYADKAMVKRERRARIIKTISVVAKPKVAVIVAVASLALLGLSMWQSRDRIVGTLEPGAPELRPESRFNRDAVDIARDYDVGLDWLTVVFESKSGSCGNVAVGKYEDDFVWQMSRVEGVQAVKSFSDQLRTYNRGYNEGNPKMDVVPSDPENYAGLATEIARVRGYVNTDCSMTAAHLFLTDHKATTISRVVEAVKTYRQRDPSPDASIRLASGNAGVLAAINEELEISETPMLLYVYGAILLTVLLVYRDFRAAVACCLPLTVGTFIGYWFMKECNIGLTVATLPVMVLAVGIGVDYALYIYNRLQMHLADGASIVTAMGYALEFEGMATIFTAITLSVAWRRGRSPS